MTTASPIYRLTLAQAELIKLAIEGRLKCLGPDPQESTVYRNATAVKGRYKTAFAALAGHFTVEPTPNGALPYKLVPSEYAVASLEGWQRRARRTTLREFERATKPTW